MSDYNKLVPGGYTKLKLTKFTNDILGFIWQADPRLT